jgi:hypothetical protein
MLKEIKLIELYCTVCHYYDTVLAAKAQRMSNNDRPLFTDGRGQKRLYSGKKHDKISQTR